MKIGLIGFEFGSANKGCEALVYSFISIISEKYKDIECIYNFSGTKLGKVPNYFNNIKFINVPPKLKDLNFKYLKALHSCNLIFDVSMGDSFSDIYSKNYYQYLIKHKKIASFLCSNYVLLPQTYGPFKYEGSADKAKKVLKKAIRIYCRDEMSQKLLEEKFSIFSSVLVSDMAFILPYDKALYSFSNKEKIGINVSGLLYKGGFHKKNQFDLSIDYKALMEKLIERLSEKYEIHLIPHVIDVSDNAYDDDYKICKELKQKYPQVILAPAFDTPIQAKSYISNMNIFIGSRMHSTIASYSSGVVTIPISYSRKFEGLFGSINYPFVVNAKKESTESAYTLVMDYICKKEELAQFQKDSYESINKKNREFKTSILELLEEY